MSESPAPSLPQAAESRAVAVRAVLDALRIAWREEYSALSVAEGVVDHAIPILRAQWAEEVAGAIEAERDLLHTATPTGLDGSGQPFWIWDAPYNEAASIVRNYTGGTQ